jgi:hypothetical protein
LYDKKPVKRELVVVDEVRNTCIDLRNALKNELRVLQDTPSVHRSLADANYYARAVDQFNNGYPSYGFYKSRILLLRVEYNVQDFDRRYRNKYKT